MHHLYTVNVTVSSVQSHLNGTSHEIKSKVQVSGLKRPLSPHEFNIQFTVQLPYRQNNFGCRARCRWWRRLASDKRTTTTSHAYVTGCGRRRRPRRITSASVYLRQITLSNFRHQKVFRPNRLGRFGLMPWRDRPSERNHHRCSLKRVGDTRMIHCWRSFDTIRTGLFC